MSGWGTAALQLLDNDKDIFGTETVWFLQSIQKKEEDDMQL